MDAGFVDKIVAHCIEVYQKLPKTGKPIPTEWTVMSCIIELDTNNKFKVISLGTGSKCIGATKMCPKGLLLNDSHAEVLARRGFLVYLYENIDAALKGSKSIFKVQDNYCSLKDGITFAFYSSQLPCGDASIIPKAGDEQQFGDLVLNRKRKVDETDGDKGTNDIHRTGAKCLPESQQDPKSEGLNYHLLGQVRTKPGRGDRTLSVSCSDKMARWTYLGIQGSLINMLLLEPIYISYYIFGANNPYSEESLTRALICRNNADLKLECTPKFYQSNIEFMSARNNERLKPASGSIVWINSMFPILEVAIQGKKLGVTKKNKNSPSCCLSVSKYSLFRRYITILKNNKHLKHILLPDTDLSEVKYDDIKRRSSKYNDRWIFIKDKFFKLWTVKPKMWHFSYT